MDDTDYVLGRTNAEYDRLIEQAELLGPLTARVFRAAGIRSGMHVLDIGCGVGDVSFLVADLVGAGGSVVGIDLDANALRFAEERRSERAISNVVFREADARSVQSDRQFDAAVGRFVLMFINDPTAALKRIAERVRPGGVVAFHEWMGRASPANPTDQPVLASLLNLICTTVERSGACLNIGAELSWRMREAGLEPHPAPLVEIAVGDGATAYRRWSLFAKSLSPKIVEYGIASEEEVRDIVERQLRDELLGARDLVPLSWPMVGQWASVPT